ncbi:Lsr2 family protein, partial [Arthrobacter sp. UYCu712]|uniref:histone-like nucleoid-structuring protein Lsr2 n=1 Tax=Arthrobacter sp. UYCu712 TaxID=3156340 RepID=UPI003390B999
CLRAMIREFPPVSILGHETHTNTGLLHGDPTNLNESNAAELREALQRFTQAARKTSDGRGRPAARKSGGSGIDTKAVRLWAIDNGLKVNTRGRIQSDIIEKYQAAN